MRLHGIKYQMRRQGFFSGYHDFFVGSLVGLFSYFLLAYNTEGDQWAYRRFYEFAKDSSVLEVLASSSVYINSSEPIYPIIVSVASKFLQKDFLIASSNAILSIMAVKVLSKEGLSRSWSYLLVLTNFYFIVLYTGAERLKFSLLLFLLAAYIVQRGSRGWISLLAIACLTHIQVFILIVGQVLWMLAGHNKLRAYHVGNGMLLFGMILMVLGGYYMMDYFLMKFSIYSSRDVGYGGALKILALYLVSLYSVRSFSRISMMFIPLLVGAIALGGDRLVIFAFFVYVFLCGGAKRGLAPWILACVMFYFSIKSIGYVARIIEYGDGFYGVDV